MKLMADWSDRTLTAADSTPEHVYINRRRFLQYGVAVLTATPGAASLLQASATYAQATALQYTKGVVTLAGEPLTTVENFTGITNFYEFGFDKRAPAETAKNFKTVPWSIEVNGAVNKPGQYDLQDLLKPSPLEERIYRWRCVETWSMVVPWIGIPLSTLINALEPTAEAQYVEFTSLYDPEQMPEQKRTTSFPWPYVEGLRLDEARHSLALLAVGAYGRPLANQNGAPVRVVIPWKYGFKSPKSIAKIRFTATQPATTWSTIAPDEYGFYANVNPDVDHPRWSQRQEKRIGEDDFRETLLFNGYAEQVASLYAGMDLQKNY
jgi:methionine sulfoxide reductase catalytic subunit